MNTQGLNLFIVDDNPLLVTRLKSYLSNRFGTDLTISTFDTGESVLKKINQNTSIVILDYNLNGKSGSEVLKSIKMINPKTEVIMHTSNEDIATAIESFRNGASDYVIKGEGSRQKITSFVYATITYPITIMGKEFGMNKYVAIFLLTFITVGITVYFALKYLD